MDAEGVCAKPSACEVVLVGGMVGLATTIRDALEKARKGVPAERGIMSGGGYVSIGTKTLPAHLAVDIDVQGGDAVWCQVVDDGMSAVIVGM